MSIHCSFLKHRLQFKFKAGTSRGVLENKDTYFIIAEGQSGKKGIGEAGPLMGLSFDDRPDFEHCLVKACNEISQKSLPKKPEDILELCQETIPEEFPSIRFGMEVALLDLFHEQDRLIMPNSWSQNDVPISINGLVWMGNREFMLSQIKDKLDKGFSCIKMKIGAIDFSTELELLGIIRKEFSPIDITLRVDANGAFYPEDALYKLFKLEKYSIHSIEQPIRTKQYEDLTRLCNRSPIPIALDEELIGIMQPEERRELLDTISPSYLVLKPTLLGGIKATKNWIELAERSKIGWWITSALESNIGLNAIAQFASSENVTMPQGLGTGQLYHNNIPSPLEINNGFLNYNPDKDWDVSAIL